MTKAQCYQCRDKQHNLSKATYKKYQGDCENRRLHDISKRVNCFSVYCGLQTGKKSNSEPSSSHTTKQQPFLDLF